MKKPIITESGQPCRKCGQPVKRQTHAPGWQPKPGRTWFRWWFKCEGCRAIYMVEAAKEFAPKAEPVAELLLVSVPAPESAETYANRIFQNNPLEFT